MAQFSIEIPDEYTPGVEAAKNDANNKGNAYASAEDYAGAVAAETALRWCEQFKVGPFWTGPVNPEFNADGTPYEASEIDE
jgi:hypothetical protein